MIGSDRMNAERDVVLLIADISGYTRFMVANQTEVEHSQAVIGALLEAILREVEIPLTVAKLEGDALFLYLEKEGSPSTLKKVEQELTAFFRAFSTTLRELATMSTCTCGACRNIGQLRLKIIVHSGKALIYSIASRTELAGVDVILVHRLLKNSIPHHEYILLTDPARRDLTLDLPLLMASTETYDEIGTVNFTVYAPAANEDP